MTLYGVLGVRPDATDEQIKRAYRRIARDNHPDRYPNEPEKIEHFKAATVAYAVLSDPVQRAIYDRESRYSTSVQELLAKMVGGRVLSVMLPHAPAARRDGEDLIACLPVAEGYVEVSDPREPSVTHRIAMPRAHRFARVADLGAAGTGGGAPGALYLIPKNVKE